MRPALRVMPMPVGHWPKGRARRVLTAAGILLLFLPAWLWGALALYYGSWPRPVCLALAAVYGIGHVAAAAFLPGRRAWLACAAWFVLLPVLSFNLMQPSNDRKWQPDVARLPYAEVAGGQVVVHNVRNCLYRSETDYTPRYETRRYNLAELRTGDVFLVDWGLHKVAHTMVSFGFADGQYLCFSIETRKEVGESYSALKGLFRQYEVIFVAADERDLVRLRTDFRTGETVRLYRMVRAGPEVVRGVFLDYLSRINRLAKQPEWYNAVTENCMVGFFQIARKHTRPGGGRWHWSVLLNGYADRHAYERGNLDQSLPFEVLKERSVINDRARAAGDGEGFYKAIREGLPGVVEAGSSQ